VYFSALLLCCICHLEISVFNSFLVIDKSRGVQGGGAPLQETHFKL
jgi:hypothetical protein